MKALEILQEQCNMLNKDVDGVWISPDRIKEAIKEFEDLISENQNLKAENQDLKNSNNELLEGLKSTQKRLEEWLEKCK